MNKPEKLSQSTWAKTPPPSSENIAIMALQWWADTFLPFRSKTEVVEELPDPKKQFITGFFDNDIKLFQTDLFQRHNAFIREVTENYGEDFIFKTFIEFMQNKKLNGGLTGAQEADDAFPGIAYNVPAFAYLCEVVATCDAAKETLRNGELKEQTEENKNLAYGHFIATIALWAEHNGEAFNKTPTQAQAEEIIEHYTRYKLPSRKGHLKHKGSFPDAEVLEDDVKEILDVHPAGKFAQEANRQP